jgi:pre-mRNA-splicing factor SYF1
VHLWQLWYAYLKERRLAVRGLSPEHPAHEALCNTYERALVSMHKMPRVWVEFLEHTVHLGYVTRTRRAFDRALAALPITQHDRIWVLYLVRW